MFFDAPLLPVSWKQSEFKHLDSKFQNDNNNN